MISGLRRPNVAAKSARVKARLFSVQTACQAVKCSSAVSTKVPSMSQIIPQPFASVMVAHSALPRGVCEVYGTDRGCRCKFEWSRKWKKGDEKVGGEKKFLRGYFGVAPY